MLLLTYCFSIVCNAIYLEVEGLGILVGLGEELGAGLEVEYVVAVVASVERRPRLVQGREDGAGEGIRLLDVGHRTEADGAKVSVPHS